MRPRAGAAWGDEVSDEGEHPMSGQNSEVNRVIDDTAEGHVRRTLLGEGDAERAREKRPVEVVRAVEDADTEGHVRAFIGEGENDKIAGQRAALRTKLDDAETEGHRVLKAQEAEELRARSIKAAFIDDDEAEGHIIAK
jgi:hypothetical protein